jgi:hypothetical protein
VLEEHVAKQKTSMKQVASLPHADFLLGLFFNPEDRGSMFL